MCNSKRNTCSVKKKACVSISVWYNFDLSNNRLLPNFKYPLKRLVPVLAIMFDGSRCVNSPSHKSPHVKNPFETGSCQFAPQYPSGLAFLSLVPDYFFPPPILILYCVICFDSVYTRIPWNRFILGCFERSSLAHNAVTVRGEWKWHVTYNI